MDSRIPWHLCCGWPCKKRTPGKVFPKRLCRKKQLEEPRAEMPNRPSRPSSISFSDQSTPWALIQWPIGLNSLFLIKTKKKEKQYEFPVAIQLPALRSCGTAELNWLVRSCVTRLTTPFYFRFSLHLLFGKQTPMEREGGRGEERDYSKQKQNKNKNKTKNEFQLNYFQVLTRLFNSSPAPLINLRSFIIIGLSLNPGLIKASGDMLNCVAGIGYNDLIIPRRLFDFTIIHQGRFN